MKRSAKVFLVLFFWGVLLSWYLRVFPFLDGPGMTGGFGTLHDWPRFHLVKTGTRSNIPSGMTETSAKMNTPMDLTTYVLAMYTLISGNIKLSSGLKMLQTLPNLLYFIPAVLGVGFYRRINNGSGSNFDKILLFVLGLFISPVFVSYTNTTINQAGYGICIYAITIYLIFRFLKLGVSARWVVIFTIFSGIMVSIYHTYGLLVIFITPGYYILEFTTLRFTSIQNHLHEYNNPFHSLKLLFITVTVMITIGLYYSTVVSEIVWNLVDMFVFVSESSRAYTAAKESIFYSALDINLSLVFARRLSKFLIRLVYLMSILYFFYKILRNRFRFERSEELFLFLLLSLYPIVFLMFFSYGGIGVGIQRTAAAGSPVIIFVISYILYDAGGRKRKQILQSVIVIVIFLTVIAQLPALQGPQPYSKGEKAAIQFTGQSVETSQMIFSDPRVGGGLLYYEHRGLVHIRVIRADWEQRLRKVYFADHPQTVRQAIIKTINYHTITTVSQTRIEEHYILTSKRMSETGISLESLTYREKPDGDFYTTFDSGYNRVYHSGDGMLYSS